MADKKEVKRGELVNAAKELNTLLDLNPQIDVKAKPDALKEGLLTAAGLLDVEDDIGAETHDTLEAIGADLPAAKAKEKAKPAAKKAPAKTTKKPAAKAAEPTLEELTALAGELNGIEGMVEIEVDGIPDLEIIHSITEAAGTLDASDAGKLTDAAWATLKMLGVAKPVAKKAGKAATKASGTPKAKKGGIIHEKDKWGFRPGCKKSQVMDKIATGKASHDDLVKEFKGQVGFAIKETAERTGTVVEKDKNGIMKIKK